MNYRGDYLAGDAVDFKFNTRTLGFSGATLSTFTAKLYKGNETSSEVDVTSAITADFDSITGLNHFHLVLAAETYAAGYDYDVVLTAGTVDGVSVVGTLVASFSIENRNNEVNVVEMDNSVITELVAGIEAEIADDATGEAVKQAIADKIANNFPDLDDLTLAAIGSAVKSALTIDGLGFDRVMTAILATAAGKVSVTDNGDGTYTAAFKKQNGSATALSVTYNPVTGERTVTPTVAA